MENRDVFYSFGMPWDCVEYMSFSHFGLKALACALYVGKVGRGNGRWWLVVDSSASVNTPEFAEIY